MNATVGSDFIYALTLVDKEGDPILFTSITSMSVTFTNKCNDVVTKTIAGGEIVEGSATNIANVEVQDADTTLLDVGNIDVLGSVTLPDIRFSDGQATSTFKLKLVLK